MTFTTTICNEERKYEGISPLKMGQTANFIALIYPPWPDAIPELWALDSIESVKELVRYHRELGIRLEIKVYKLETVV